MSARDDYPNVALQGRLRSNGSTRIQYTEALDEIDRLRTDSDALRKQVVRLAGENTQLRHAEAFEKLADS